MFLPLRQREIIPKCSVDFSDADNFVQVSPSKFSVFTVRPGPKISNLVLGQELLHLSMASAVTSV